MSKEHKLFGTDYALGTRVFTIFLNSVATAGFTAAGDSFAEEFVVEVSAVADEKDPLGVWPVLEPLGRARRLDEWRERLLNDFLGRGRGWDSGRSTVKDVSVKATASGLRTAWQDSNSKGEKHCVFVLKRKTSIQLSYPGTGNNIIVSTASSTQSRSAELRCVLFIESNEFGLKWLLVINFQKGIGYHEH